MRVTHLVQKTPLEKLINKLLVYSFILILHPLSSLPASTRARQTFCFLIRGGPTLLNCLLGQIVCGTWEEGGRVHLHMEAHHAIYNGGRQGRRKPERGLGREPDKPGQPSPTALVSLFPSHSLARHFSLLPQRTPRASHCQR